MTIKPKYKVDEIIEITREAFDNICEAICICDKDGEVIFWNKASEILYNIKKDEIIGKYVGDFFPNALTNEVFKTKKVIKDVLHQPVEGKRVFLSAAPIFNSDNQLIAVITSDKDVQDFSDIMERLKKEEKKSKYYEDRYKEQIAKQYSFSAIISKNKKVIEAIILSQRVAPSNANVMITGESGTGKDVFATSIHNASGRKGKFVAVNCSAIPEELLESAFTGARKGGKIGKFELANNGTLFLDEVTEMPYKMQSKLLRVLQDGKINRLGSDKTIETDVRIIAATNMDIKTAIDKDKFRSDLFYRLAVVSVDLPPLRERKEDIKDLTKYFVKEFSEKENISINSFDDAIYNVFESYFWDGNIRELKNVVQRMVVLSNDGIIKIKDIPSYIANDINTAQIEKTEESFVGCDFNSTIKNLEIKMLTDAIKIAKGNRSNAAKLLNLNRTTFYYKINLYKLENLLN